MILDTNALSAFAGGDEALLDRIGRVPELFLPVVVLGEFRFGIRRSRYRRTYERWLDVALSDLRILAIVESTTDYYAAICVELKTRGKPIPINDVWISALSREHNLPILSLDRHFDEVPGVRRIAW